MGRRFSYEPINLIHRIPTPQQMDAARPTGPSFGQTLGRVLVKAGSVCWRKTLEFVKHVTRHEDTTVGPRVIRALPPPRNHVNGVHRETTPHHGTQAQSFPNQVFSNFTVKSEGSVQPTVVFPSDEGATLPGGGRGTTEVREEEVAAMRSYIVGQQQDIASLTAQIRELKSLVASQQQVLVHLGEELETGSFPAIASRSASAAPRRDRIVRDKPLAKESAVPHSEHDSPSLNL